jgi:putative hydrolase of the HAD superfamily
MRTSPYLAVCLDFGDTLMDESTQVRDPAGGLVGVELIPGALELLRCLSEGGHRLALVADGPSADIRRGLEQHGLERFFGAVAISEEVGAEKPDPSMFLHALSGLGIGPGGHGRVVMVGNRLERDIRGATQIGMVSVWMNWSSRYAKVPAGPSEIPDHTIRQPLDLLTLMKPRESRPAR